MNIYFHGVDVFFLFLLYCLLWHGCITTLIKCTLILYNYGGMYFRVQNGYDIVDVFLNVVSLESLCRFLN